MLDALDDVSLRKFPIFTSCFEGKVSRKHPNRLFILGCGTRGSCGPGQDQSVDCPPTVRARLARPLCLVVGRGHGSDHDAVLPELKELLPLHDIGKLDRFTSQEQNHCWVVLPGVVLNTHWLIKNHVYNNNIPYNDNMLILLYIHTIITYFLEHLLIWEASAFWTIALSRGFNFVPGPG